MTSACVINETAARRLGLEDPLGARLYLEHPAWEEGLRQVQVIGVVRDFHSRSLHTAIRPFVFRMYKPWTSFAFVKIGEGEPRGILARLQTAYEEATPGFPFTYEFLSEAVDRQYVSDRALGSLFNSFTLLSVLIACLGLYGLASFTTEQKTKEIGIRKVLGASTASILGLFSRQMLVLIAAANLIAVPVALFVVLHWLEGFAFRMPIGAGAFVLAFGGSMAAAFLTISYQSLKAAHKKPVDELRSE